MRTLRKKINKRKMRRTKYTNRFGEDHGLQKLLIGGRVPNNAHRFAHVFEGLNSNFKAKPVF